LRAYDRSDKVAADEAADEAILHLEDLFVCVHHEVVVDAWLLGQSNVMDVMEMPQEF
jgi:hypothetical protein